MLTLLQIIAATFAVSVISLIGIVTFFLKRELLEKALMFLVALASGGLIGGAFLQLIPEAIKEAGPTMEFSLSLVLGFSIFFFLEQILWSRHGHETVHKILPFSYLVLLGDGLHNFVDGLVIAASFVVSPEIGIVTTTAVSLHEIPQELGDFGVLTYGGFSRKRALMFNFISAGFAIVGGIIGYFISSAIQASVIYLLPFAAGNFIYIAAADLIPEIKHTTSLRKSALYFCIFLAGIGLMFIIKG